jgi:uncharacterized protein (TIGR02145 family)
MVTYRDGTPIPEVTDNDEWGDLTTGAWCYYDNDPTKGKLYNWYAVMGIHDTDPNTPNKEFAPEGWHVPTDAEWTTLEEYLIANGYNYDSTTTGNKIAKAMASTTGWNSSTNPGAIGNNQSLNNSSGYNTFPEGFRFSSSGEFSNYGEFSSFWSSDDVYLSSTGQWHGIDRNFSKNSSGMGGANGRYKGEGISVRFVRNDDPDDIDYDNDGYSVNQGDCDDANAQVNPGATEIEDGVDNDCDGDIDEGFDVDGDGYSVNQGDCDDANSNVFPGAPELEDGIDNDCDGEIDEGFNQSGTVTDIDGNTYDYLTYGDQVWTVDNAEMVTYRDGTPIPEVTDNDEWGDLTTGAWCYQENDPTKPRLYNWYAIAGIHDTDPNTPNKEFAPEGWHVPTDAEWTTLENYLIANGYNYDGTTIENKIAKAMASTTGWNNSATDGTPGSSQNLNNSSGFNAFPEGFRQFSGSFYPDGIYTRIWSSTEYAAVNAWYRYIGNHIGNLGRLSDTKTFGNSVRFVRD